MASKCDLILWFKPPNLLVDRLIFQFFFNMLYPWYLLISHFSSVYHMWKKMLPVLSSPWYSHIYIYISVIRVGTMENILHSIWHMFYYSEILSGILCGTLYLNFGAHHWGPAVPTDIWRSRLKSGSAHWHLALAVEVRQSPLRSGAHSWGRSLRLPEEKEEGGGGSNSDKI